MKLHFLILSLFAAGVGGAEPTPREIAGAYRYDGMTQLIELALLPNGSYLAHWSLDIYPDNGSASGTWRLVGDEVHLAPKKEEGALKGHLRILLVRTMQGRRALLRKEDLRFEGNPFFYFHPKEKPNKALQPTPMSVTDRAAHAPRQP